MGSNVRCSGPCLSFTVSDDAHTDKVRFVHDRAKRDTECIAKLSSLVN